MTIRLGIRAQRNRSRPKLSKSDCRLRNPKLQKPQSRSRNRRFEPCHLRQKHRPQGRAENPRSEEGGATKADIFEPVTLQISPDTRDEIQALARDLQRAKTTKEERITANTVMRVALQLLLKNYQFEQGDVANNEAELYELIVRRFRKK